MKLKLLLKTSKKLLFVSLEYFISFHSSPFALLVLGLRTICAEPLQIDKKREENFIKAIFLSEEKRLVDKGCYQGEND